MDAFNDKKWFVYMGNGHEGPYSLGEIQAKMRDGIVTNAHYVWAEGMADWKPMTEVADFSAVLQPQSQTAPQPEPTAAPAADNGSAPMEISPAAEGQPAATAEAATPAAETGEGETTAEQRPSSRGARVKALAKRAFKLLLLAGVIGGGGFAYQQGYLDVVLKHPFLKASIESAQQLLMPQLLALSEKVPVLQKWVSPIPPISEISQADYEELKLAARGKVDVDGPKVALSLSEADPASPTFYIASNLPEGAVFELYIEGIPETLLNHLSFSHRMTATLIKKIGKTGILRFQDGKAAPKGKYNVFVVESDNQPDSVRAVLGTAKLTSIKLPSSLPKNRKVVTLKEVFVGGKADKIYLDRLREFHVKLTEKAAAEVAEVKQLSATLEGQLTGTNDAFTRYRADMATLSKSKLKAPKLKAQKASIAKTWSDFNSKWQSLTGQLDAAASKWTPEAMRDEFFHGALFFAAKSALDAVKKLHALQETFVAGTAQAASFDVQIGETQAAADATAAALRAKIETVEKATPSPNGMPKREAL